MTADRVLTAREAARLANTDVTTIRRHCLGGETFPNAVKTPEGDWRIPLGDLIAAGRWTPPAAQDPAEAAEVAGLQAALTAERAAHAQTLQRLAVAEALFDAERRHSDHLREIVAAQVAVGSSGPVLGAA